ncbi:MAG: DUF177 domain-containing protein [Lentisphaerae bacterium]|nr:DUF177 domain-containing protein [Lentisphaerota bacterium]
MIIHLNELTSGSRVYRGEDPPDIVDVEPGSGLRLVAPISYVIKATRIPAMLLVTGELASRAELRCVRCDTPFIGEVRDSQFERSWELTPDGLQWVRSMDDDPVEEVMDKKVATAKRPAVPASEGRDCVDLTGDIREAMILAFPGYPVCSPECKGLCATCGVNLNEAACRCAPPDDNRWAILNRWAPGSRRP